MAVGLVAWGRFFETKADGTVTKITVPAPPTDPGKPWLADFLRSEAPSLGQTFDAVLWPPISKAQGGAGAGCDGDGVFDLRDLGTKDQQGSIPTRYGTLESKMAAVAALDAHGVASWGDCIFHQKDGDNPPGFFVYKGASGAPNGRGQTTPGWFRGGMGTDDPIPPFCREDDVPDIPSDNAFGRELSYGNCNPPGITLADAVDFLPWLTARVGFRGYRFDDVKGTLATAVDRIMDSVSLPFCSEYFDGNPQRLDRWVRNPPISSRSSVFDFTTHFRIQMAANGYDATQLLLGGGGYWQQNPSRAHVFVDNPDTDTSPGEQVVFNKGLAYAWALTVPCDMVWVYGKDYFPASVWPGAYGLRSLIDNLCWINRTFAFGTFEVRYLDRDVVVVTRDGNGGPIGWSGGLLTALNFNTWSARTVTVQTPFGANRWLHDYTGHIDDVWTDADGRVTVTVPSNYFSGGQSFVCLAPGGVDGPVPVPAHLTSQTFVGDDTLDVLPLRNGLQVLPQRLCCAAGTEFRATLSLDHAIHLPEAATVQVEVLSPDGSLLLWATTGAMGTATVAGKVVESGWHTLRLVGNLLPASLNFHLTATYTGTSR